MRKRTPSKKASSTSSHTTVQGLDYWLNRPFMDKGDWGEKATKIHWISGYWASRKHPHRHVILRYLKMLPRFKSLGEVGCNCGPNLALINQAFPNRTLLGTDVNLSAVVNGKLNFRLNPNIDITLADGLSLPWGRKTVDVLLADAVLMYFSPDEIDGMVKEIKRVTKKAVVVVERHSDRERHNGYVWSRNYPALFKRHGFKVFKKYKLKAKDWPTSKGWQEQGWLYVFLPA